MEYLINKINLESEFQRIVDSGWECRFSSEQYKQTFILSKPNQRTADIGVEYFTKLVDDYKNFTNILDDFFIVYSMIISNHISKVDFNLLETSGSFIFTAELEKPPVKYVKNDLYSLIDSEYKKHSFNEESVLDGDIWKSFIQLKNDMRRDSNSYPFKYRK